MITGTLHCVSIDDIIACEKSNNVFLALHRGGIYERALRGRLNMGKKTILIVEDDAAVRGVLISALERQYTVLEASGCSEAAILLRNPVDIALIDYMLPDGDGFDVLKEIRKKKTQLPVIIMTAYSTEDVVLKALRAGATEYIKKPMILSQLRKKVADMLKGEECEEPSNNYADKEQFLLDGVKVIIDEHYREALTRDVLAKKICMNKYRLSKLFNERFGQSIKSYLNNVRVKKAAELLRNDNLSIRNISSSVGFRRIEHFDRIFKEIYSMSPREYRLNQNKTVH